MKLAYRDRVSVDLHVYRRKVRTARWCRAKSHNVRMFNRLDRYCEIACFGKKTPSKRGL